MSSQEENITKFSRNINADDESKTGLSDDGIIRKQLRLIMSFRNLKKPELKS